MPISLIGAVHVLTASIGLLSGLLSMLFRKGSGLHGAAGTVFFVSMLTMSATGAYHSAFVVPIAINVVAGLLTFYLVATSWRAARVRTERTGIFDVAALLLAVAVGLYAFACAARTAAGAPSFVPAPVYLVFGAVAFGGAAGDLRLLRNGGIAGASRLVRHLWRMCLAFLIAILSLYPGQGQLFPRAVRDTNLLFIPHFLVLGVMLFWIARMSHRRRVAKRGAAKTRHADVFAAGSA